MVELQETDPERALQCGERVLRSLDALERMVRSIGIDPPEQQQSLRMEVNQELRELTAELTHTPEERALRRWVREQFRYVLREQPMLRNAIAYGTWKDNDARSLLYHVCLPMDISAGGLRMYEEPGFFMLSDAQRALALAAIRGTLQPPPNPQPFKATPLGYAIDGRDHARWMASLTPEDHQDLHDRIHVGVLLQLPQHRLDAHWRTWEDYLTKRISAEEAAAQFQARHSAVRTYAEELLRDGYHQRLVRDERDRIQRIAHMIAHEPERLGPAAVRLRDTAREIRERADASAPRNE